MLQLAHKSLEVVIADSKQITSEMKDLLEKIQSSAISLSVDTSELISIIKKQDPEYAKQIENMESAK